MSYDAPPPPPPGASPYGAPPPAPQKNSSKAVWALVCGIVGLLCFGIVFGIVAIVLGRQAQKEGARGGMAKAGEILGYVDIALSIVYIIFLINR